jgi:hypothetical protein
MPKVGPSKLVAPPYPPSADIEPVPFSLIGPNQNLTNVSPPLCPVFSPELEPVPPVPIERIS